MITKLLSQKLVLMVIGLAAGSGILIPAGYASFHPVTSSEIQNETILSVDIKNGEVKTDDIAPSAIGSLRIKDNDVKAQDIAPDAVGASELIGVTKLLFVDCGYSTSGISAGGAQIFTCTASGVQPGDNVVATNNTNSCIPVGIGFIFSPGTVGIVLRNECSDAVGAHSGMVSAIVFQQ